MYHFRVTGLDGRLNPALGWACWCYDCAAGCIDRPSCPRAAQALLLVHPLQACDLGLSGFHLQHGPQVPQDKTGQQVKSVPASLADWMSDPSLGSPVCNLFTPASGTRATRMRFGCHMAFRCPTETFRGRACQASMSALLPMA